MVDEALGSYVKRPKVLLIENSRHRTGAFSSALFLAKALRDTHEVEFVLASDSQLQDQVVAQGIVCHSLPMSEIGRSWNKLLRYLPVLILNTIRLRRLLAQRGVAILLVNDYYNLLGVMVRLAGWRGRIVTMVRLLPKNQQPVLNWFWTHLGLKFTDRMVAVSHAVDSQLPASGKLATIYNPIYFAERHPKSIQRIGCDDGLIHCLYPANYISGKGHDAALDAFAVAYSVCPSLRLRFVGGDMGLEKNRSIKAALIEKCEQLGISEVVQVDDFSCDIESDIKQADVVLNFSESESFSQTCLEASMFGRPVIATRCGGPAEIIEDEVSGLLVPIGDVSAMSAAMLRLARDIDLRLRMGKAGAATVRERFSSERFLSEFLPLCQ